METPSHEHDLIFNDDGFEVCTICGVCSSLREMRCSSIFQESTFNQSNHSDILRNNHIGYADDIESEYEKLKSKFKRGYPNIVLYAYCTYIVLMRNSVYYTMTQIGHIFQISNFQKYVCLIEKKQRNDKSNLIDDNISHIRSSIEIFLTQNMRNNFRKNAFHIADIMFKRNPYEKSVFLISIVLFFTLVSSFSNKKELLSLLCNYYSINERTLCKKIKKLTKIKL